MTLPFICYVRYGPTQTPFNTLLPCELNHTPAQFTFHASLMLEVPISASVAHFCRSALHCTRCTVLTRRATRFVEILQYERLLQKAHAPVGRAIMLHWDTPLTLLCPATFFVVLQFISSLN